jgi:hypothetical protein
MDDDEHDDEERTEQVRGALFKALGVLVVVGVAIYLGTTVMVRALGLNDDSGAGPVGSASSSSSRPLPTKALPVPGESDSPTDEPTDTAPPSKKPGGDIQLEISPLQAKPMERVNFTGSYQGADNVSLEVQRFEDGTWSNFGVQATVRVGTFTTYILTGHTGENRFRVFDPQTKKGSNVILVTIK